MKVNFKKSAIVAISALSILVSAPSVLCLPRTFPAESHISGESYDITLKPIYVVKPTPTPHNVRKLPKSFKEAQLEESLNEELLYTETINTDEIPTGFLDYLIHKTEFVAPFAKAVGHYEFIHQVKLKKIVLPEVCYLGSYAFKDCENLEEIVVSDKLTAIEPDAFAECNPNLQIICEGEKFSVSGFLSKVRPIVRVDINWPTFLDTIFSVNEK